MKINNAPARYEGPHSQLGNLIRQESFRHLDAALEMERTKAERAERNRTCVHMRTVPRVPAPPTTEPTLRSLAIENNIWGSVTSGWARPLEDWSALVFWNPAAQKFEPWSLELNAIMLDLIASIRPLVEAEAHGRIVAKAVSEMGEALLTNEKTNFGRMQ